MVFAAVPCGRLGTASQPRARRCPPSLQGSCAAVASGHGLMRVQAGTRQDSRTWRFRPPVGNAHILKVLAPAFVPVKHMVWPLHGWSRVQMRAGRARAPSAAASSSGVAYRSAGSGWMAFITIPRSPIGTCGATSPSARGLPWAATAASNWSQSVRACSAGCTSLPTPSTWPCTRTAANASTTPVQLAAWQIAHSSFRFVIEAVRRPVGALAPLGARTERERQRRSGPVGGRGWRHSREAGSLWTQAGCLAAR